MTARCRIPRAASLGFLTLGLLTVCACDTLLKVTGSVRDAEGKPLPGVTVSLLVQGRVPDRGVSGADGSYSVRIVGAEPANARLVYEKPGYQRLERPAGTEYSSVVDVVLRREAP